MKLVDYRVVELVVLDQPISPQKLAELRAEVAKVDLQAVVRVHGATLIVETPKEG